MADPVGVGSTCPIVREAGLARARAHELGITGPRNVLLYIHDRLTWASVYNSDELRQRFRDAAELCRVIALA